MNYDRARYVAIAIVFLMISAAIAAVVPVAAASGDFASDRNMERSQMPFGIVDPAQNSGLDLPDVDRASPEKDVRIYVKTSDISQLDDLLVQEGLKPTNKKMNPYLNILAVTVPERVARMIESLPSTEAVMPFSTPVSIDIPGADEGGPNIVPGEYDAYTVEEHNATTAWASGFDGSGVNIAIIDSGVDFGHPDLMGRQARENNPASPYFGWPLVFDVNSIDLYEGAGTFDGTWYADTSTVLSPLGDFLYFDGYRYNVSELPSFLNLYFIGYHPDRNLVAYYGERVAVLVTINVSTLQVDTVYVDLLNDKTFNNDKPCYKGNEVAYFDVYNETSGVWDDSMWDAGDGIPDISGGMVYWIADGANRIPMAQLFYPASIPSIGSLVCFSGEFIEGDSHGTGCAASAVGTGKSLDGILAGMAPGASIITVPTYNSASIFDIWIATVLGYDFIPGSGDEADIASNSYGWDSMVTTSGFDFLSGINYMIASIVPSTIWLWSTGNGGPGYGTASAVTHPLAVQVGAAASMGYRYPTGSAATEDEMFGDVIPFSDHGPTKAGKLGTDVIAAGAWGLTAAPMYTMLGWSNGNDTWMIFGGTSMACPVTAGAMAIIYQAYAAAHGAFPTSAMAKSLLMSSADDVNHDVLKQGAGYVDVGRAVDLARDLSGVSIAPIDFMSYYYEDAESGDDGWTHVVYTGTSDLWHISSSPGVVYDGAYSWYMGIEPAMNYNTGERVNTALVSPIIDITELNEPHISVWEGYDTEPGFDAAMIEVSNDGGAFWTTLTSRTGNSVGWIQTDFDVSAWKTSEFMVRFHFDTGDALFNNFVGWAIDDFLVYDNDPVLTPTEISNNVWYAGSYHGLNYSLFPSIVLPGDIVTKTFRVTNHDLVNDTTVTFYDAIFTKNASSQLSYTTVDENNFLVDLAGQIPVDTDLVRITAYCSYDDYFDPGRTYNPNFNYGLELMNFIDLDMDMLPAPDGSEFNRITVDGGVSNVLQVTMHDPMLRIDDGLFIRMRAYWGGQAGIEWNFQIDCYNKTDWSWVGDVAPMLVPAGLTVAQTFTMSIPSDAKIGTYEGAIYLSEGGRETVLPVLVHVAADSPEFEFGGDLLDETIFDNNMTGAADREWRYEVGDWRVFYMDVDPAYPIAVGDKLYVTVNWSDVPTDVDVNMLAPSGFMIDQPYALAYVGGSSEMYMGAGNFGYRTTTGGPKEVVGVPFDNGLNAIALRNPIGAGLKPYEQITGFTKVFNDNSMAIPNSISVSLNIPAEEPTGSFPITILTGGLSGLSDVEFGASCSGPVGGAQWLALMADQDDYTDTMFQLTEGYSYLKIMTSSAVPLLDIDLYVYMLDQSTMSWIYMGTSAGSSATETVYLSNVDAGIYVASVYGYTVPGGTQPYDLAIEFPIAGAAPFEVTGAPTIVNPFNAYMMNVSFDLPYVAGTYAGFMSFGYLGSLDTYRIPLIITLIDTAAPVLEPLTPTADEVIADQTPEIQVYFNDTAAFSGMNLFTAGVALDGWWIDWEIDSGFIITAMAPWTLSDGAHQLYVEAGDNSGNDAVPLDITFYVDTGSELAVWMENSASAVVPSGGLTNESSIDVIGIAEPDSTVEINGVPVTVNAVTGSFGMTMALAEGVNSFTVEATDAVGNIETVILIVTSDTVVNMYVTPIASPTKSTSVAVSGTIEAGGAIRVDGTSVAVTNGAWSTTVDLSEGLNSITVEGMDVAGNTAQQLVSVILDTTAPVVEIISPTAANTSDATITVLIDVTGDPISVSVNGVSAHLGLIVNGTTYEANISLREGANTILVLAVDSVGNIGTDSVQITYDPPTYVTPGELDDLSFTMMLGFIGLLVGLLAAMIIVFALLSRKISRLGGGGVAPAVTQTAPTAGPAVQPIEPGETLEKRVRRVKQKMDDLPPPPEEKL